MSDLKNVRSVVVDPLENGFLVRELNPVFSGGARQWAFQRASDLAAWMKTWGEIRHPQPDAEEPSLVPADKADAPAKGIGFRLSITHELFSVSFDSSTSNLHLLEAFRRLKVSGDESSRPFRVHDLAMPDPMMDTWFSNFRVLLVYLLAEYPGLMSGTEAVTLMSL